MTLIADFVAILTKEIVLMTPPLVCPICFIPPLLREQRAVLSSHNPVGKDYFEVEGLLGF